MIGGTLIVFGSVLLGPPMPMAPGGASLPNEPTPEIAVEAAEAPEVPTVEAPRPTVDQLAKGQAYRPLLGDRTTVSFHTEAPMGSFEGHTGEVLGFLIVERGCLRTDWAPETDDTGTPRGVLLAGAFSVPVISIDTGMAQRNAHMASTEWMNAQAEPAIVFELAAFEQPRKIRQEAGVTTFEGALVGDFVMHGKRKPMRIEHATVAMMPESESSTMYGPGDLLMIRCSYALKLADFGLDHPLIGRSVGKSVQIEQAILMTSAPVDALPAKEPTALETPPQTGERMDPKHITPQH